MSRSTVEDHAVVIGAGVAGLLTARVLAAHFSRVTVLERDELLDEGPEFRPGVAQSRHVHVLWWHGLRTLEDMLPGFTRDMLTAGAHRVRIPADMLWLSPADWFQPLPGTESLYASRELTDWTLRRHVTATPGVTLRSGREVTGLIASSDTRAVRGVVHKRRGAPSGTSAEETTAGFVVDTSGRTARTTDWLARLDCPAPPVTRCDAKLAYASRYYRTPAANGRTWKGIYVQAGPDVPRAGVLIPIEGERWIVTLLGSGEDAPPTDDEAFTEFTRSLRSPVLYEAIRDAEPLSSATGFRDTANVRHHFERASRWPDGFVVLGDAACRFNPVYGHGMTVAALTAHRIAELLRGRHRDDIPGAARRIQKSAARSASAAWAIATGEDLRYPQTEGLRPKFADRLSQRYMQRVLAGANVDPGLCARFFDVLSLAAPPTTLLGPSTAARVLRRRRAPDPTRKPNSRTTTTS
ncbi:FAD-dependent monooxygenase [Streptomyces sp. NA04227]|uniref:NAD(P)/FAD-dependent oxidoreductase n=1 Tax=Streptomyces sp. NA04227 TaxID=2742136 RepID=UPI001592425C|nr:FAD-dependent monooxygenase [Streptomyces sp. NA04227]QKW10089.1 FAD-dependent monooxygenase [Streptomyces sp. NA04227]